MLRVLSARVCGGRKPTPALRHVNCPGRILYTLLFREISSAGPEPDQGFTVSHCGEDGRRFQFATVVAKVMKKGDSPLRIWEHACGLIGGNSPTLAVAFISKPTDSALRSIRVLAGQLARTETEQSPSCCSEFPSPSSATVDGTGRSQDVSSDATQASRSGTEALNSSEHVPLIGCIMDDLSGEFESTSDGGISERNLQSTISGTGFSGGLLLRRDELESRLMYRGSRDGVFNLEDTVDFDKTLMGEVDGDEVATVSDWESLWSEYREDVIKVLESNVDVDDEIEDDKDIVDEKNSNESFINILQALSKRNPFEEPGGRGDWRKMVRSEQIAGTPIKQVGDELGRDRVATMISVASRDQLAAELGLRLQGSDAEGQGLQRGESALFGDVEGTIIVEPRNSDDNNGVSGSDPVSTDVNYKLVLCVGHLPGVKAVAFHSSSTGLPRLSDLEHAVTVNNPHMLLFGAPGFEFPDFVQRLGTVFPNSCRAGAFLSPLFTSKRSRRPKVTVDKSLGHIYFGAHVATSGVVGLAISGKEEGSELPRGAFAEFARMSVGMPRIRGYIFLDERISKELFLPKNVPLRQSSVSAKASTVSPSAVLDHLKKRLLRESAVPSVVASTLDSGKQLGIVYDSALGSSAKSTSLLSSDATEEESNVERLPLALLDSVLFPGWSMPFYIYEPCYRTMVRQCAEQGKPFGLSSLTNGSWAAEAIESGEVVGTIANLKVHTIEKDCRSYIIAHGVRRFRVINERVWSQPASFGLTMGQVQFFDDQVCDSLEEKEELLALAKRAVSLCCDVISEAQSTQGLMKSIHDPRLASFAVGHVLDVPTRVKRRWLTMVNTKTRLLEQITFLETRLTAA